MHFRVILIVYFQISHLNKIWSQTPNQQGKMRLLLEVHCPSVSSTLLPHSWPFGRSAFGCASKEELHHPSHFCELRTPPCASAGDEGTAQWKSLLPSGELDSQLFLLVMIIYSHHFWGAGVGSFFFSTTSVPKLEIFGTNNNLKASLAPSFNGFANGIFQIPCSNVFFFQTHKIWEPK